MGAFKVKDGGSEMISRLSGPVVELEGDSAVIDVQGVGYTLVCTSSLLKQLVLNERSTVCVYTDVREDAIRLFGFSSPAERRVFLLLNKVSGMGPRSSIDVLSNVSIHELLRGIGSGDVQSLMRIKGVGRKKAERIVVELKDLVGSLADEQAAGGLNLKDDPGASGGVRGEPKTVSADAVLTLETLGFTRRDAEIAVSKALDSGANRGEVGEIVRDALRFV
jgi:Holliday junction DNA helicase RuvA